MPDSESTEGEGEIIGSEEAGDPSNNNTDSNNSSQEDTDSDNTDQEDANQGGSNSDNTSENNNSSDGSYPVDKDHFIIILQFSEHTFLFFWLCFPAKYYSKYLRNIKSSPSSST